MPHVQLHPALERASAFGRSLQHCCVALPVVLERVRQMPGHVRNAVRALAEWCDY